MNFKRHTGILKTIYEERKGKLKRI